MPRCCFNIFLKKDIFPTSKITFQPGGYIPPNIKYNVGKFHITLHPARLAYNQPGVFVEFRRCLKISKNIFQKKPVSQAANDSGGVLVAERERTTLSPNERG